MQVPHRLAPELAVCGFLCLLFLHAFAFAQEHDPEYLGDLGPQGPENNTEVYGYGAASNDAPIRVGDVGTWRYTYHVGLIGVDDGGRIWLLSNIVSDWRLQTSEPAEPNYVTATTSGKARLELRTDRRHAGTRPYWGGIEVTVRDGSLGPGDTVTITIGDRSAGSIGAHAPSIVSSSIAEMRFAVDALNSNVPVRVAKSPLAPIEPGPAVKIEAIWPSESRPGTESWLLVKAKDLGGNAAEGYRGAILLDVEADIAGLPDRYQFTAEDKGFHRFRLRHNADSGSFRVRVTDEQNASLNAHSNLQTVMPANELRLFCGDLHGQHNRGSATAQQYAEFARNFGGADFMSWAVNDFHLTEANWQNINRVSARLNEPGRFIVFPGYEWSATTSRGGDHNIIFKTEGMRLLRSGYAEHDMRGYDPATDRYTVPELLDSLDPDVTIVMPHIGGRRADLAYYDPEFMFFVEMYSSHGQFEWFLREALERELFSGFVASSDDAWGKLGDSPAGASGLFAVHGGITCVYAEALSRDALWQAFKEKRVYGTTGERIQLRFRAGQHWSGETIRSEDPLTFSIATSGTQPIEKVEIFRNLDRVHTYDAASKRSSRQLKVLWRGASSRERARQSLWTGSIILSQGSILSLEPYRIDQPNERTELVASQRVDFDTVTSGDEDGVIIEIDDEAMRGTLTISAAVRSRNQFGSEGKGQESFERQIVINDLADAGIDWQLAGLDRGIAIRSMGSHYPDQVSVEWRETDILPGASAYWVKVTQVDGATAWSSPVYVKR